jgi:hypothetical protein
MTAMEEVRMARYARDRTLVAVMRDDGTIYFPPTKPRAEQIIDWTIVALWVAAFAVLVATFF